MIYALDTILVLFLNHLKGLILGTIAFRSASTTATAAAIAALFPFVGFDQTSDAEN